MEGRSNRAVRSAAIGCLALIVAAVASSVTDGHPPTPAAASSRPEAAGTAAGTPTPRSTPAEIALAYLASTPGGPAGVVSPADAGDTELRVDATARSEGVTHVYVQQQVDGIDLIGANANVAVAESGRVEHAPERLIDAATASELADLVPTRRLSAVDAVGAALRHLGVSAVDPLRSIGQPIGDEDLQYISDGGVATAPFESRLVYLPDGKGLVLGWEVQVQLVAGAHLQIVVAADDGRELRRDDYTISHSYELDTAGAARSLDTRLDENDPVPAETANLVADGSSYRVLPFPVEAPSFGTSTVIAQPADDAASPFGWHDTDGVAGAESTLTIGNNVDAYLDTDADDTPDAASRPDGGAGLDFTAEFDADDEPDENTNPLAAVTQLFYASNWAHDFFHAYGFDEAAGNFQTTNYTGAGTGGDPVNAEALDGYANSPTANNRDNANFTTPPDGSPGRMQMYGFTLTSPERAASFDNGVVLHEYGHGWSTRLTGGRNNVACLNNAEQMGEGWSDFAALIATMLPSDTSGDSRGIGTYVVGQSPVGNGIRQYRYSTDLLVNPHTYGSVASVSVPHGVGSVWAAMLWEVTWALIDRHGFDADLVHGDGGNNRAMQLVSDGLKLQPCAPGFVDGRDAILAADRISNGGDQCLIWEAFAKRGLGWSAEQGSPFDPDDGTEAFDLPPGCPISVTFTDPGDATIGQTKTLEFTIANSGGAAQNSVSATVAVPTGLSVLPNSLVCDATVTEAVAATTISVGIASLAADSEVVCSFEATATANIAAGSVLLDEDFESGIGAFTTSHDDGALDWGTTSAFPLNGSLSAFATNPSTADETSDQFLVTPALNIPPCSTLEFVHEYDTEASYDGGVIEVRQGGGPWSDLGGDIVAGAYDQRIATEWTNSPISGREAFTGTSDGSLRTVVDLDAHAGSATQFRFRYASDATVSSDGWRVDDVRVTRGAGAHLEASVSSLGAPDASDCAFVDITDAAPPSTTTSTTTTSTTTTSTPTTTLPARAVVDGGVDGSRLQTAERLGAQG